MALEEFPKGSYIWRRLMLHEDQAQTKSSKMVSRVGKECEKSTTTITLSHNSAFSARLRHRFASPGHVCAHAYLPIMGLGAADQARGAASELGLRPGNMQFSRLRD